MHKEEFVNETRRFWSDWSGEDITDEDAHEIIRNMTGFFSVLAKWRRQREQREGKNAA
ncbi:MAG: hypothetical protein WC074_05430 [bacterium]